VDSSPSSFCLVTVQMSAMQPCKQTRLNCRQFEKKLSPSTRDAVTASGPRPRSPGAPRAPCHYTPLRYCTPCSCEECHFDFAFCPECGNPLPIPLRFPPVEHDPVLCSQFSLSCLDIPAIRESITPFMDSLPYELMDFPVDAFLDAIFHRGTGPPSPSVPHAPFRDDHHLSQ